MTRTVQDVGTTLPKSTADRLDDETRVRALEELQLLDTGPDEGLDRITRLVQRMFGVSMAMVTLVDRDRLHVKSQHGAPASDCARDQSFCTHTIEQPEPLVVDDLSTDPRFASHPLVAAGPHLRFYAGHPLQTPAGHRLGALCLIDDRPRSLDDTERQVFAELARWVERELVSSAEMDQAAEVQRALVPRDDPAVPGFEVAGACLPSRGVGGDLLDWYRAPDGDLVVTLGDVMGKGMAAAIVMATVRAALRATTQTAGPAEALRAAADALHDDLERTRSLVTLCQARLSPADATLRYSDAGHGLLLLVRAEGAVRHPAGGGLPFGVLPGEVWPEHQFALRVGDTAVAFSDGVLDLFDSVDTAVEAVATLARRAGSAVELVDAVTGLAGRVELLADDVTVVAIRRTA